MKILKFKIKDDKYARPLGSVQEIIAYPDKITKVPLTPEHIKGLINLRGNIVTIFSTNPMNKGQSVIVLKKDQNLIGLDVDSVNEVGEDSNYTLDHKHRLDLLFSDKEVLILIKDLKDLFPGISI